MTIALHVLLTNSVLYFFSIENFATEMINFAFWGKQHTLKELLKTQKYLCNAIKTCWSRTFSMIVRLTSSFLEIVFDAEKEFWKLILGTSKLIIVLVEGCNTNCCPIAHQTATTITLWGSIDVLRHVGFMNQKQLYHSQLVNNFNSHAQPSSSTPLSIFLLCLLENLKLDLLYSVAQTSFPKQLNTHIFIKSETIYDFTPKF